MLFFFLIIDLYFLISASISQVFNPIAELAVPIGKLIKKAKVEIKIPAVIAQAKIIQWSIYFRVVQTFLYFQLINSFCSISSRK